MILWLLVTASAIKYCRSIGQLLKYQHQSWLWTKSASRESAVAAVEEYLVDQRTVHWLYLHFVQKVQETLTSTLDISLVKKMKLVAAYQQDMDVLRRLILQYASLKLLS